MLLGEFAGVAVRSVRKQLKEPRLSHRCTANSLDLLRDAGQCAIANRKDLAPYAGLHSKCLARAGFRLALSFVCPAAGREAL